MMAVILPTGLKISLQKEEKSKEKLECIVSGFNNMKVFLNIVDKIEKQDSWEEKGFHIECLPLGMELRRSSEIYIYLSKERWNDLTTKYDPESLGGYFESRSKYDRCSFHYWDEKMIPKREF